MPLNRTTLDTSMLNFNTLVPGTGSVAFKSLTVKLERSLAKMWS